MIMTPELECVRTTPGCLPQIPGLDFVPRRWNYSGAVDKPVTVYILRNSGLEFYIGITNNLERRLRQHQQGKSKESKKLGPPSRLRIFHIWQAFYVEDAKVIEIILHRMQATFGNEYIKIICTTCKTKESLILFLNSLINQRNKSNET